MSSKKNEEIKKGFGLHLKNIREGKGISLRELEASTGVDYSSISKIETGERNPSLTTLFILAEGLEVEITELVSFKKKDN